MSSVCPNVAVGHCSSSSSSWHATLHELTVTFSYLLYWRPQAPVALHLCQIAPEVSVEVTRVFLLHLRVLQL